MDEVYLYILCRQDIGSMANNAGLLAAQATHSSNQMVFEGFRYGTQEVLDLINEWQAQTGKGFGTAITLSVDDKTLKQKIHLAQLSGIHAAITHDPTFPVRDGKVIHLVPVDTCGYILGRKGDCFDIVGDLRRVGDA